METQSQQIQIPVLGILQPQSQVQFPPQLADHKPQLNIDQYMLEKLFDHFEDFNQKLQNMDGKLVQPRNVVNGLVNDVNAIKKPPNQINQSNNDCWDTRKVSSSKKESCWKTKEIPLQYLSISTQLLTISKIEEISKRSWSPIPEKATKKVLLEQSKPYHKKNHPPKTIVEIEAEKAGHKVLYLPSYPKPSPIE